MIIKELTLINFRKYIQKSVFFSNKLVIITGPNASGKSTILEAISVLGTTRSFRKCTDKDLATIGKDNYFVKGLFESVHGSKEISVAYNNDSKTICKNKTPYKKMSELLNELKIVTFSPVDSNLINGTPQERRQFLNLLLSQSNREFVKIHNNYMHYLKERNSLLKTSISKKIDLEILNVITNQLIDEGNKIIKLRSQLIEEINKEIRNVYYQLSGNNDETVCVKYLKNVSVDNYRLFMNNALEDNLRRGITSVGPHRDDIIICLNEQSISTIGSQGQQRDAIISLKMCVVNILATITNDYPIFLLDDVFSELDMNRQNNVMKTINNNVQTIITSATISDIKKEIIDTAEIIVLT